VVIGGALIWCTTQAINFPEFFRDTQKQSDAKLESIDRKFQIRKALDDLEYTAKRVELKRRQEANDERLAAIDAEMNDVNAAREELEAELETQKSRYQQLTQNAQDSARKQKQLEDQIQRIRDKRLLRSIDK